MGRREKVSIAWFAQTAAFVTCVCLAGCTVQDNNLSTGAAMGNSSGTSGRAGSRPLPEAPAPASPGPGPGATIDPKTATPDPSVSVDAAAPLPPSGPDASVADAAADRIVPPPAFDIIEIANWRGGADGAYSIVHDSVCDASAEGAFVHADPALSLRALRGGFSVIAGACGQGLTSKWPRVRAAASHGHEIINQSFSAPCLGVGADCGGAPRLSADFAVEIDQAAQALQDNTGARARFFVFPFNACGQQALAHLRQAGYLGARCGERGISTPRFPDSFAIRFDAWGPSFSVYGRSGPCVGFVLPNSSAPPDTLPQACRLHVLNQYVDDAITQRGWAMRTLGGFVGDLNAPQPIDVDDYAAHLDFVRNKVELGQLWVEGPTAILKYRWARERCPRPSFEASTLVFPAPSPECLTYATPLSYVVTIRNGNSPPPNLRVTQAGLSLPARTLALGRYLIDADPSQGDATVTVAVSPAPAP